MLFWSEVLNQQVDIPDSRVEYRQTRNGRVIAIGTYQDPRNGRMLRASRMMGTVAKFNAQTQQSGGFSAGGNSTLGWSGRWL